MLIKSLDLSNTISLCIENRLGCMMQGPYSRNFIFFVMYEWAQKARVFQVAGLYALVEYDASAYWPHS
jgi:hypothetical protein